ncbi:hypothetical protein [Paenibacillus sp.]
MDIFKTGSKGDRSPAWFRGAVVIFLSGCAPIVEMLHDKWNTIFMAYWTGAMLYHRLSSSYQIQHDSNSSVR